MHGLNQNTAPNLILVKTALDKLYDQATIDEAVIGKAEAIDPVIFTQDTADKAAVVSTVIGGGGYFQKNLDDIGTNNDAPINAPAPITTLIALFKKDLPIARTFMADQQQMAVSRVVAQQAKTWIASRDRNAFGVYGNGFTSQVTIDGKSVFNVAHTNENGDTIDNYYTGALGDDNLNILVNALRTQLSQTGVIIGYEPKFLLVPSILHKLGMSITKSVLRAGTGNNDLNYWSEMYPGMKVAYSPFLDPISTTAYFIGSTTHGIVRFEREAFFTELVDWKTDDRDEYKYKMRAREEVDSIEYSGLAAADGTTS